IASRKGKNIPANGKERKLRPTADIRPPFSVPPYGAVGEISLPKYRYFGDAPRPSATSTGGA
ncbi:hypothetical protein, partial [Escherichia coli]|uniref:hypothetical protein n=1 Tax=Escherichia coli TaxID=562 RepID=UPI0019658FFE